MGYTGDFDFDSTGRGGKAINRGLGTYFLLKTGLTGVMAGKRALDRGQSTEEAVKTGAIAAIAWQGLLAYTMCYFMLVSSIIARPLTYYSRISRSAGDSVTQHSTGYFWTVTLLAGGGAFIVLTAIWLIMYSRLKDKMEGDKGRMYRRGFRIRRRVALMTPWWMLWLVAIFSILPLYILL